ncbi:MAG: hypothetical protein ORN57_05465 [Alphaproteobacteria bacterium]|nr:hypothetical protein [Alphaproteobacteria bacterium]
MIARGANAEGPKDIGGKDINKDLQALMKEMQTKSADHPNPMVAPEQKQQEKPTAGGGRGNVGDDSGYYQEDYYPTAAMSTGMKFFFAVQTLLSLVMVVLLVMMFNMFSSMRGQALSVDSLKGVLQTFVDGLGSQNKAMLDELGTKVDGLQQSLMKAGDDNTAKTQESLDNINKKIDKAISRPPVIINKVAPVKKVAPATTLPTPTTNSPTDSNMNMAPGQLPDSQLQLPALPDLNNLNNLPPAPSPDKLYPNNKLPNTSAQQPAFYNSTPSNDDFQLPPLPSPTQNFFPQN